MADPTLLPILAKKIKEVESYIADMERRTAAARHDLVHLQACVELFRRGPTDAPPAYMGLSRVFGVGEQKRLALAVLKAHPEGADIRVIAEEVMGHKGVQPNEKAFRRTVIRSLSVTLHKMERRGVVRVAGRSARANVWALR